MSGKRNYWSKMDHSEARNATALMSDDEAGRWLRGWLAGAAGEDAADSTPMEWRMGFSAGKASLQDAEAFSRKQSERVSARYTKATAVDPVEETLPDATGTTAEYQTIPLELPDATNNTTQQTNKTNRTKKQQDPAATLPPSMDDWKANAAANFPWWPLPDVVKAFAYYQGREWQDKGKPMEWRRRAGTWSGNWAKENTAAVANYRKPAAPVPGAPAVQHEDPNRLIPAALRCML